MFAAIPNPAGSLSGRVVGPDTAVDQPQAAERVRRQIGRRRGGGERHVHHRLAAVAAEVLRVRRTKEVDVVVAEVVGGDRERDRAVGEGRLAEGLLERAAEWSGAVLAARQPPDGAQARVAEDRGAMVDVEVDDLLRSQACLLYTSPSPRD